MAQSWLELGVAVGGGKEVHARSDPDSKGMLLLKGCVEIGSVMALKTQRLFHDSSNYYSKFG